MTNTRIILFSILIAVLLAILVMWCADVLAHGEGKCLTDVDGNVPLSDGGWVKVIDHLEGADLEGYVHGHRKQYYDRHGNPTGQSRGFFSIDFDDDDSEFYADCPTAPPPRSRQSSTPPRSSDTPTLAETLDRIIEEDPEPPGGIEISEPPAPLSPVPELVQWEHQFYRGWNLMSFAVLPEEVETLSDLYHHWAFFAAHNAHIVVNIDGEWLLYSGEGEPAGEIPLSAHLGLAVRLDWAAYLGVRGVPLPSAEAIDLYAGANLVGFPVLPADVRVPSDLLSDTICAVIVTRRGQFYLVGRAGDSGDEALENGQAVILIVTEPTTLKLTAQVQPNDQPSLGTDSVRGWGAEKVNGTD